MESKQTDINYYSSWRWLHNKRLPRLKTKSASSRRAQLEARLDEMDRAFTRQQHIVKQAIKKLRLK